jgi:hypothetical protein
MSEETLKRFEFYQKSCERLAPQLTIHYSVEKGIHAITNSRVRKGSTVIGTPGELIINVFEPFPLKFKIFEACINTEKDLGSLKPEESAKLMLLAIRLLMEK